MSEEKLTVRSVFGNELDVSQIAGLNVREITDQAPSILQVENGEPGFVYAWLVANDPTTTFKLRKGMYELVDAETDPVICAGAVRQDNSYRVNELVLVRAHEEDYRKLKGAAEARALRRELGAGEAYKQAIRSIGGESTNPMYEKTEVVRSGGK